MDDAAVVKARGRGVGRYEGGHVTAASFHGKRYGRVMALDDAMKNDYILTTTTTRGWFAMKTFMFMYMHM